MRLCRHAPSIDCYAITEPHLNTGSYLNPRPYAGASSPVSYSRPYKHFIDAI